MLKKISFIAAAVLLTFAMLFVSCGEGVDWETYETDTLNENPIVKTANYIYLSGRTADYFTVDIRAGRDGKLANFTDGMPHTITVYGTTRANTAGIRFAQTDSPWGRHSGDVDADATGAFKLEREFSWAEINNATQNIRIQVPVGVNYNLYEITIVDAAKKIKYKMSEDDAVQGATNKKKLDDISSDFIKSAGSGSYIILVPGEWNSKEKVYYKIKGSGNYEVPTVYPANPRSFYADLNETYNAYQIPEDSRDPANELIASKASDPSARIELKNTSEKYDQDDNPYVLKGTLSENNQFLTVKLSSAQQTLVRTAYNNSKKATIKVTGTASIADKLGFIFYSTDFVPAQIYGTQAVTIGGTTFTGELELSAHSNASSNSYPSVCFGTFAFYAKDLADGEKVEIAIESVQVTVPADDIITNVNDLTVKEPHAGTNAGSPITAGTASSDPYNVSLTWSPAIATTGSWAGLFAPHTVYTATLTFSAKEYKTFDGFDAMITVNGQKYAFNTATRQIPIVFTVTEEMELFPTGTTLKIVLDAADAAVPTDTVSEKDVKLKALYSSTETTSVSFNWQRQSGSSWVALDPADGTVEGAGNINFTPDGPGVFRVQAVKSGFLPFASSNNITSTVCDCTNCTCPGWCACAAPCSCYPADSVVASYVPAANSGIDYYLDIGAFDDTRYLASQDNAFYGTGKFKPRTKEEADKVTFYFNAVNQAVYIPLGDTVRDKILEAVAADRDVTISFTGSGRDNLLVRWGLGNGTGANWNAILTGASSPIASVSKTATVNTATTGGNIGRIKETTSDSGEDSGDGTKGAYFIIQAHNITGNSWLTLTSIKITIPEDDNPIVVSNIVYDLAKDTGLEADGLGTSKWFTQSGNPLITVIMNGSDVASITVDKNNTVAGAQKWNTIDLKISANEADFKGNGNYKATLIGTTTPNESNVMFGIGGIPGVSDPAWSNNRVTASSTGAFTVVRNFTVTGSVFETEDSGNDMKEFTFLRLLPELAGTDSYTITSLIIEKIPD